MMGKKKEKMRREILFRWCLVERRRGKNYGGTHAFSFGAH